jgi:hypothetical protein
MRIYLRDKPFTTIEEHIRNDILSRWPQQRVQTEFGNHEMYLACEINRTNGPVIVLIDPQEIQTLFDLVAKFAAKGSVSAKKRKHVMHVVLDNYCPELAPSISSEGTIGDAAGLLNVESQARLADEKKGKGRKSSSKENVS